MRAIVRSLVLAGIALFAGATAPSLAEENVAPRCNGFNLLDKLAATDPALHARILAKAHTTENSQALLWRIERPGVAPSHLFGTIHLSDPRILALSEATRSALEAATVVVIESADLSPAAAARAYTAAAESARFTDGQTLDKLLTKAEFTKVRRTMHSTSAALRPYRPWIISLMLTGAECERRRLESGQPILDMAIANRAKERAIPLAGLETLEEQFTALAAIPDSDQIGILRTNLALVDESENLIETMVQLYLTRRVGTLWDLQIAFAEKAGVSPKDFASFEEIIILDRNRKMQDGARPHLDKGGAFIAVGALHLPGENGLVALLRKAGYTLTAVE